MLQGGCAHLITIAPSGGIAEIQSVLQRVAVCYSVLQCITLCCSVLQYIAVCFSVLQCGCARLIMISPSGGNAKIQCVLQRVAVRYSVLQCITLCCSVLQCVAVCCSAGVHAS